MNTDSSAQFISPFDQLERSSKLDQICQQTLNCSLEKEQTLWQPAFPISQIQKPSPPHSQDSQASQQHSQSSNKSISQSSNKSISQSSNQQDYTYLLDSLSESLQDLSLSSQALNIQLQSDSNQHQENLSNLQIENDNQITNDLIQVYQFLAQQGKGKVLSSKKNGDLFYSQELKTKQDKIVAAKAFINRGYGINQLKQQLRTGQYGSLTIDECRYKSVAGSMVRQSFRNLEAFLLRDCKQKLHNMAGYQMKLLQTLLLNCRTILPHLHSKYFMQIVSITYNLSENSIYQNQCLQLYNSIHQALMKKIAILRGQRLQDQYSYSSDQRPKRPGQRIAYSGQIDPKIITAALERQIITQFINVESLSQVRDLVRSRYRIEQSKLNIKVIRNILRRVMRATIRKIEDVMIERRIRNSYRSQQRMNDENIKSILQTAQGSRLRRQLCKLHLSSFGDIKQVEHIARELWQFVRRRGEPKHSIQLD